MLTRHAQRIAREVADGAIGRQKVEYAGKLGRLKGAFEPSLTNSELSDGLGLRAPVGGASDVGRFLSESARLRRVRPDSLTRAVIDSILEGRLWIAVRQGVPGARRQVVVGDDADIRPLGAAWTAVNFAGRERPTRRVAGAWDDAASWDLFRHEEASATDGGAVAPTASRTVAGFDVAPIGLGAMRLSTLDPRTKTRPSEGDAVALLLEALDAGLSEGTVRLIDTADSYCADAEEAGHNERLIRRALDERHELRGSVLVATKAGLVRPGGRWLPNGRPEHLRAACEASLVNLGVDALDLLQLHAVDPKVPLEESVGALRRLVDEGKVRHVGLCNVTTEQLDAARAIVDVASVQNRLSLFDLTALRGQRQGEGDEAAGDEAAGDEAAGAEADEANPSSLLDRCHELEIPLIAHSPLGGHRQRHRAGRNEALREVAARYEATPHEVALAWLLHLGPRIVPIPGATRIESLRSSLRATSLRLDDDDFDRLTSGRSASDRREVARTLRPKLWAHAPAAVTVSGARDEIVLILGPPAAGKTSRVAPYLESGYLRLNRDEVGGRLDDLVPPLRRALDRSLAEGRRRVVLDNTYPTRASRRAVLETARAAGVPVVAIVLDTPIEDALQNACLRMLQRHGEILSPEDLKKAALHDPNMLPPAAIHHWFATFEPPTREEGFARIETVPFVRSTEGYDRRALILDYDGTLRRSNDGGRFPRRPEHVEILPRRRELLDQFALDDWLLLGVSNQSGIARGMLTEDDSRACFERTNELLGNAIDVRFCPHAAIPAGVWCRKPMPGLGVALIEQYKLDRSKCLYVGDLESDEGFARSCGFVFAWAWDFFDDPEPGSSTEPGWPAEL